jgi:hypothetical protein
MSQGALGRRAGPRRPRGHRRAADRYCQGLSPWRQPLLLSKTRHGRGPSSSSVHPVEPVGCRNGGPPVGPAGHHPIAEQPDGRHVRSAAVPRQREGDRRRGPADRPKARGVSRRWAWPGCSRTRSSPHRSSAQPSRTISPTWWLRDLKLTENEIAALENPYTPRTPTYF